MIVTYRPALGDLVHAARTWEGHHWKISSRIATAALLGFGVYCIYTSAFKWAALFVVLATSWGQVYTIGLSLNYAERVRASSQVNWAERSET